MTKQVTLSVDEIVVITQSLIFMEAQVKLTDKDVFMKELVNNIAKVHSKILSLGPLTEV